MATPSSRSLVMTQDTLWGLVDRNPTPPLYLPQPLPPEDPGTTLTPSHTPYVPTDPQASDHSSLPAAAPIHTASSATGLSDPVAQPTLCYPDQEEIEEDQLHRVLAVNALT
ncbi:hypothetical protein DSO57_1033002 [Entomophthora muscae]|uniref:Uncharacterized protein n=1 Tax=Entomophthora muscae TaxID=34485 RepID=A0ACC2REV6_9FUNG|nr:hypothetical protein DSO57_1033002 [Entomophthora muscae]